MTTRRLFEIILLLALFTIAVRETVDPDMWWHLRTGQVIVEDGLPRQDIYSFTSPDNTWVTHEWLSEVVMWLVFNQAQFTGLIILFAILTALAYWLVYLRSQGRPYLAAFVVLTAALASAPFWGVRPQVFNILLTALFVYLVEGYRDGRVGRRTLWLLPLLTLIWANLHSGYLYGIALLVAYITGEGLQRLISPHRSRLLEIREIRHLGVITLLCFLAAALNPNGPSL
ncbi:MAG: hypothetical protein R3245_10180, partial [Kiloniellales bacterium]|nr:hypothetical protein [Kiloniellales bacterium]